MTRLPTSLDALGGLRAARWIRESTERQVDRYGPDAQREQQDQALARYGLADTGLAWQVAHSGRTVAGTYQFADMLARAGHDYDVLLVGYVSRFARDLRTAVNARHELHAAGRRDPLLRRAPLELRRGGLGDLGPRGGGGRGVQPPARPAHPGGLCRQAPPSR